MRFCIPQKGNVDRKARLKGSRLAPVLRLYGRAQPGASRLTPLEPQYKRLYGRSCRVRKGVGPARGKKKPAVTLEVAEPSSPCLGADVGSPMLAGNLRIIIFIHSHQKSLQAAAAPLCCSRHRFTTNPIFSLHFSANQPAPPRIPRRGADRPTGPGEIGAPPVQTDRPGARGAVFLPRSRVRP